MSELKKKYNNELAKERKNYESKEKKLDALRDKFEEEKSELDSIVADQVKSGLKNEMRNFK